MLNNEVLKGTGSLKKQSTNSFKHSKKTNGIGKTMSAIVAASQSPQETSKGFHNSGNPTPVLVASYNMASRSSPTRKKHGKKQKSVTSNIALPPGLTQNGGAHLPPSNRARVNATAGSLPTSGKQPQHVKSMGGVRRAEARDAATVDSENKSKDDKPKEPIFLPSTGIDLPFLKRRP